MGPRYGLQHFLQKIKKLLKTQQLLELEKKYAHIMNPQNFRNFLMYVVIESKFLENLR
jgi:hypothetical protein